MEKQKRIIKLKVSETKTIELDLDELEKDTTPSPKLEGVKLLASRLPSQIRAREQERKKTM